jgi:DNA-binding CsgD family transcriptional regulator
LWLGFDKGVSYVDLTSPLRPLFAGSSPVGVGCYSAMYGGSLYLGTVHGLYKMDRGGALSEVPKSGGQIWHMAAIGGDLLCSGDDGITAVSPAGTYKIDLPEALEVHPLSNDKSKLIACTYSGFHVLEKKGGRWQASHPIPDFWGYTRGLLEDDESGAFWLIGGDRQVQKLTFDREVTRIAKAKKYELPCSGFGSNTFVRRVDNSIVVCAKDGIYRYCRLTDSFERYSHLESMLEGAKYYEYLDVDAMKNIWFIADNQLKELPFESGVYQKSVNTWGLDNELVIGSEHVLPVDSATAVVAVNNAFVKIDKSKRCAIPAVAPHIRKLVSSKNDSAICYGQTLLPVVLPYSLNSIRIHLAATALPPCPRVMYSCRLRGLDSEWSLPSPSPLKEYTSLGEGRYVFEVKTVVAGQPNDSDVASLQFEIRPPWFRSAFAYIIYAGNVVALLFLLYKKTIGRKNRIIQQKEQELLSQSSSYRAASSIKDREIYELHSKNLQAELDFKRQEVTGYVLNLKRKNEILLEVKKKALNIAKELDEHKERATTKRKIQLLISQINANIENDSGFEVFQSNFNLIHQNFFKLLDDKFPQLSKSDKILCAYLKMSLSSKEIAPLQNITVRGVEVNRYRLRKKMNLSREVNLSDYLQNLGSEYEC